MSYQVSLHPKSLDDDKIERIYHCKKSKKIHVSEAFSLLLTRDFEYSEFDQLQEIWGMDFSIIRNFPENATEEVYNFERYNLLYKAEESNDPKAIDQAKLVIKKAAEKRLREYDTDHTDWIEIHTFKRLIEEMHKKLQSRPVASEEFKQTDEWKWNWGDYFMLSKTDDPLWDSRMYLDLENLLKSIDCMLAEDIEYVAFYG